MPQRHKFISRPLFMQVRDELVSRITGRAWKPGTLLPNEVQLAQEFGVSQGTMRKALDLLEAERIVVRQQGRGTTVVDHDTEEMAIRFSSIFNALDQRISGHITFCEARFDAPTEEEQKILGVAPSERLGKATRVRSYHDHPFLLEHIALNVRHFPNFGLDEFQDARLSALAQRHGVILTHARERVRPAMCPSEYLRALGLDAPVPILVLDRIIYKDDGRPVELRTAWCHLRDKDYMSITS